jgi:parallel beta-helix repeat protein
VLPYSTTYKTDIQSEASGRRAVKLQSTGDYVQFTLTAPANALVLRYAIPDNDNATFPLAFYINNNQQSDFTLDSKHSWVYGGYLNTNNAAEGDAHKFWEEKRIILSQTYNAGTTFKFQKNANCNAQYYCIDLIETEQIAAATPQPANSISVSGYSTLQDAVDAAINGEKILWIPAGEKNFSSGRADVWASLTVQGAGVWRSIISGAGARFNINSGAANVTFKDFAMSGSASNRTDNGQRTAIESDGSGVSNFTVDNVWLEYYEAGCWLAKCSYVTIKNCRIRNTFADGINLTTGCSNCIIEHNSIRNTGDDCVALWSTGSSDQNNIVRYNTIALPALANGIAFYGGTNNEISNNIIQDIVFQGGGIDLSNNFEPAACNGYMKVLNNTFLRCGSIGDYGAHIGAVWIDVHTTFSANISIENNDIYNSTKQGVFIKGSNTLPNILLKKNVFNSATNAVHIMPECSGAITLQCNTFTSCSQNVYNESSNFPVSYNNDCSDTPPEPTNEITVKIKAPANWTNVYAYVWGTSELAGGWGGQQLTKQGDFYVYTVDLTGITTASLIFNNGGEKAADIDIVANGTSCWQAGAIQGQDNNGNNIYSVTKIDCPQIITNNNIIDNKLPVVYPNPTKDIITVENTALEKLEIYNYLGEKILSSKNNTVNLSDFPASVYLLQTTDKDGKQRNLKIIKQ